MWRTLSSGSGPQSGCLCFLGGRPLVRKVSSGHVSLFVVDLFGLGSRKGQYGYPFGEQG